MIAAIDSGNSGIKLGIFEKGALIKHYNSVSVPELKDILTGSAVNEAVISDVGGNKEKIILSIPEKCKMLIVGADLKFPFKISYHTPETLGTDRIAAIAGAWDKFGPSDILAIDIGTCITYDFINKEGIYCGGGISPGIEMRLKALSHFTASLPSVQPVTDYPLFGTDTKSSIISGTLGGAESEIKGIVERFRKTYGDLKVVLCGGGAGFFESKLKGSIFVVPELVLWGLVVISSYNET